MIEQAPFGATGHLSSRIIFGAAALGAMKPERSAATLDMLTDYGVNHIDTAASYGESEDRLKPWLAHQRSNVFLATKTGDRDGAAARASLERSLERMDVGHVDMIQLHNLVEEDEWRTAFSPGGAVEALFRARDEGLCRHVGVTGHGLRIARMHLRSLAEAPFAAVLLPWNHSLVDQYPEYVEDVGLLREMCTNNGVAVQTIKSIARGRWTPDYEGPRFAWYEPIAEEAIRDRAVEFVLAEPDLFLNSSSDARLLRAALDVADGPRTPPDSAQLERDRDEAGITPLFDGADLETIR
ncbi:MAG: aryl-alcohol dehydrogenase-like predicted oxidoreductase [Candidatus Aldehydirespiratoraceae bacterium]|jgi:aryl-alcohol dehydrogenase-like predicted oxidoreductase